jgi:hypothetical protein
VGWGGMNVVPGAEIGFTDMSSSHWILRSSGRLEEIADRPIVHYGVQRPVDFQPLIRGEELTRLVRWLRSKASGIPAPGGVSEGRGRLISYVRYSYRG